MQNPNGAPRLSKMILVNIEGPLDILDETILNCAEPMYFPEQAIHSSKAGFTADGESNPYQRLLDKIGKIAENSNIMLVNNEIHAITSDKQEIKQFVNDFYEQFSARQAELSQAREALAQSENLLVHLGHLEAMNISFERIFSRKYLKIRFGRLPLDCEDKLCYYSDHPFFFFPFSSDANYIWGMYISTNRFRDEVDDIFSALFFERVHIPRGISGTPREAKALLERSISEQRSAYTRLSEQFSRLLEENRPRFLRFYNEVRLLHRLYETRNYISVFSERFYMTGFVGREAIARLMKAAEALPKLKVEVAP